jgi:hypothetical protein
MTPAIRILPELTSDKGVKKRAKGQLPYSDILEEIIPPIRRVNRAVRAQERGDLEFQALSELIGLRLIPVKPGKKAKKAVSHQDLMNQAMGIFREGEESR